MAKAATSITEVENRALNRVYDDMMMTLELITVLGVAAIGATQKPNNEDDLLAIESTTNLLHRRVSTHSAHVELISLGRADEVMAIGGIFKRHEAA